MMNWGLCLLILHMLICAAVYAGMQTHVLKTAPCMLPVVIFVPVWGLICCLILHFKIFIKADGKKDTGLERLKINEAVYRSFLPENHGDSRRIVPLEEALLINDSKIRRDLILDILNDRPGDNMDALLTARMNEDTEVVHYATSAMTELSKSYDQKLQEMEQAYAANPEDPKTIEDYCGLIREYLSQGLAQGRLEELWLERCRQLLEKIVDRAPALKDCCSLVRICLRLKEYERAAQLLKDMSRRWENEGDYHMLMVEYYALLGQGEDLFAQIREIETRHIYLSRDQEERLRFWRQ